MWKKIKLYRKQILALNWPLIIDLFCFRSTMSETECEYWQIRRGMEHVAVLMREFLQDSSRNTVVPSFHTERLLTVSFLPTIPV
jgi:hypothetical protein